MIPTATYSIRLPDLYHSSFRFGGALQSLFARATTQQEVQAVNDLGTGSLSTALATVNYLLGAGRFSEAAGGLIDYVVDAIAANNTVLLNSLVGALAFNVREGPAYKTARGQAQIINVLGLTARMGSNLPARAKLREALYEVVLGVKGEDEAQTVVRYL